MKIIYPIHSIVALAFALTFVGCQAEGNYPGREYMPDMAHSVAYEANHYVFYDFNTWGTEDEYRKMLEPRQPIAGTIPRNADFYQPYTLNDTEEDRKKAESVFATNPVTFKSEAEAKEGLKKGKELYDIYCATCHGEKGDGNGPLWKNGEGPYTAAPANYLDEDKFGGATDGRYYHAIVYGINKMMPHADKLNWEERWLVVHYIRKMQADAKSTTYLPVGNVQTATLSPEGIDSVDVSVVSEAHSTPAE